MSITQIQDKLQKRRPVSCPDNVWEKFLDFFPILCKTGDELEFPDIIIWNDLPNDKSLEVDYIHQHVSIYIDINLVCEMADYTIGKWYTEDEIRILCKNK